MEIFKQYDAFKEKCSEFPDKLEAKYFSSYKLICHPAAENTLISMCSDEEAHSNALCICRMADMLLMSDDGEEWSAFNLAQARQTAEQNGCIYLTDLLGEDAFQSDDWMINGKNDTIIVSEEYMREKGKRYAPVTPLTNKVLHFKKYSNSFFWKKAAPGEVVGVDKDYIDRRLKEYFGECGEALPDLSESETIDFPLFGGQITIDVNTTRIRTIERFFLNINGMAQALSGNEELFGLCDYEFSLTDFLLDFTAAALRKNGIDISADELKSKYYDPIVNGSDMADRIARLGVRYGDDGVDCVKLAFVDAVAAEYPDKIEYSAGDAGFYNDNIRRLELGDFGEDEEKYLVSELLSHKPADYRIFCYADRKYPDEARNTAAVAEFWEVAPINDEELENTVLGAYLSDDNFDEQGRFCAGYEESRILKEQIVKVIDKYGLDSKEVIEELDEHIDKLDKERRTFNGTLFDTPEEMKLAVKNEVYVQELCVNLSALNEQELDELDKLIDGTTLDNDTKAKYKLKVELARNNVRSSMLEQKCLKLPIMGLDEVIALRENLMNEDYPEAVVKPFAAKIREAFTSAQTAEIEDMLRGSEDMDEEQLDKVAEKLSSGRYDRTIAEHYRQKVGEIKEINIRNALGKLVEGYENFKKEQLAELIEKLKESAFPKRLTMPLVHKITDVLNNYELNEAAKTFEGVEIADAAQLEKMKEAAYEGVFSEEVAAPYIEKIRQREKELLEEKLAEMCGGIEEMSQDELDSLRAEITSEGSGFDPLSVEKYLDRITQRDCELKNSELAELCKYIFSMEQGELDDLKEKLADEKYDKEFSAVYYRKIAEREQELLYLELDRLCAGIEDADTEVLEKLKDKIIDEERYADICDEYITAINNRIESIKIADYKRLIENVAVMSEEEVNSFRYAAEEKRDEIGEELYEQSMAAAEAREDALETEAIVRICGNIEAYTLEQAKDVKSQLADGGFDPEKIAHYVERIDDRITELHTEKLESYIENIESMDKEQLIQAQINIGEYAGCPDYLREKYRNIVEKALAEIADREVREMCGNVSDLSAKKSEELIRRINTMPVGEAAKNKYINVLDAHIASLKEAESREYLSYLKSKMDEFGLNAVHLSVPGLSNLFSAKYATACSTYVSTGRYEQPLLVHDGNSNDGFTMTTEYLYTFGRGVMNRIKAEDIASFLAKRSLVSSSLIAVEKNGHSNDLPHALKKEVIENVAKVLTSLVTFIHDKRSAEHMKELLENAVQEKAAQAAAFPAAPQPVQAAEAAPAQESTAKPAPAPAPSPFDSEAELDAIATPSLESIEAALDTVADGEPYEDAYKEPETADDEEEAASEYVPEHAAETVPESAEEPAPEPAAEAAHEHTEVRVKFCDQCGAKITSPTAKFCAECGNKLM